MEFAWVGEGSPRYQGERTTMLVASTIRRWAEQLLAVPVRIDIECVGDRNRILLRLSGGEECEVREVRRLHQNRLRLGPGVSATLLRAAFSGQKAESVV